MAWATAIAAIGTGMQAYGSYAQGKAADAESGAQARMAQYNAAVAERDARAREDKTKFDQLRQRRQGRRIMGALRAKLGAAGAVMSEGAPLAVLSDQAFELELENALIGIEGRTEAERYRSQAAFDQAQAGIYKAKGKAARTAGTIGAGTSLLQGFARMGEEGMLGDWYGKE